MRILRRLFATKYVANIHIFFDMKRLKFPRVADEITSRGSFACHVRETKLHYVEIYTH